jgi:4-aminobutyrate aminotransferase-like enzyme
MATASKKASSAQSSKSTRSTASTTSPDLRTMKVPMLVTPVIPGPRSKEIHERTARLMKGLSGQVKLFPVAFEAGAGTHLRDADGNCYLDFSSGIYVTTLGHCHPKVTAAVQKYAGMLMNCHDFSTEIKMRLLEKMAEVLPGDLAGGIQLYDAGTAAVEAGIRACRAITGKHEFLSCFRDFHGKSGHAASLARINPTNGAGRTQGFYLVPRPDPYRPHFKKADGSIDTDGYIAFYREFIQEATTGQVAAFVLEPIQGWAGSVFPPDDFFPKLRKLCDERKILLFADEVLTSMGRTGEWLAMDHYGVVPDVVTLGKGFGNGFPVTAMCVRKPYAESFEAISASTSYGGNPMACAAALACIEAIQEEKLLENARELGAFFDKRMAEMQSRHPIIGHVRGKGCLMGIELVKDRATKEPFDEAGKRVYQKAFRKGLAWIPAGHILRLSPPIVMDLEEAKLGMDIVEEAIGETEKELGY